MAATASSYSITMRLHTAPDHGVVGTVATAIAQAGGIVTAIDVAESRHDRLVVDVTCSAADQSHSEELVAGGRGGSRASRSTRSATAPSCCTSAARSRCSPRCRCAPVTTCRWPTPPAWAGSAWRCHDNPDDVRRLTVKGNSVAVVTDGSAVLGLGNIGPGAALPVMEGKAALFKRFADIDAWPICLASQDTDEIVRAVEMIAPGFGGINLEDIAAPRCFEIERRLRESPRHPGLPRRPARHRDRGARRADQRPALRQEGARARCGSWSPARGAAGTAIVTLLLAAGAVDVVVVDREGALSAEATTPSRPPTRELAARHQPAPRHRRPPARCWSTPTSSSA